MRVACVACGAHRERPDKSCGVCLCTIYRLVNERLPIRAPRDAFTPPGQRYETLA
jgi:hypothetical protein